MESKDLRIGNKIYGSLYFDTEEAKHDLGFGYSEQKEWTIETVESVCSEHDDYLCDLENDTEMERLKPIPLNFKMFINLGFVKAKKREWFDLIIEDKKLTISVNVNSGKVAVNFNGWHTLPFKKIMFVHELQNFVKEYGSHELVFSEA